MTRIFLHPFAGVLSAYGMGLADVRALRHRTIETQLNDAAMPTLTGALDELAREGEAELLAQGIAESAIEIERHVHMQICRHRRAAAGELRRPRRDQGQLRGGASPALRLHRAGQGADRRFRQQSRRSGAPRRWPIRSLASDRARRRRAEGAGAVLGRGRASPGAGAGPRRDAARARKSTARPSSWRRPAPPSSSRAGRAVATARGHLVLERRKPLARAGGDRHQRRSGDAGDLQQPVHVDRRADGLDAGEDQLLGEHQGAAGFLLRPVRPATAS